MKLTTVLLGAGLLLTVGANAQETNLVPYPGPGGGYAIITPGEKTIRIQPRTGPSGGYLVTTPGQPNQYIIKEPGPGGRWTIEGRHLKEQMPPTSIR